MQKYFPLPLAAELVGVTPKYLKIWLRELGYNMPPRKSKGRYTVLIPEKMLERVCEARTPRLART